MRMLNNIFNQIKRSSIKTLLLVFVSLFLCSCEECPTYQTYLNRGIANNCLLCELFDILTKSATTAANNSWNTFATPLIPVVVIATAIYVAFYTLKMVGSAGKQDAASYLMADKKGILILGFKLAVIVLLLKDTFFIDKIISPILQAGLEVGLQLGPGNISINFSNGSGWGGLFNDINDAIVGYNDQVYETIALGQTMICVATDGFIFFWYWLMLLYGFIFFIFGWFTLATICFYIVDILINLAFGAILLPFGIAFAISNQTSQYSTKIWQIFLNAFFSFVILGVILGLSIELIDLSLGRVNENNAGSMGENAFSASVVKTLNADNVKVVSEMLWSSGSLLLTIVCFCLLVNLIEELKSLIGKISDTAALSDAGSKTSTAMASAPAKGTKKLGSHVANFSWDGTKYAGHVGARITRLDKGIDNAKEGLISAQGYLTGTGKKGYKAFWRS